MWVKSRVTDGGRVRGRTDGRVDGAAPRDEGRSPPSPRGAEGRGAADDAKRGIRAGRGELVLRGRRLLRALCRNGLPSCDIAPRPGDGIGAAFHKSRPGKTPVATSAPSNGRGGIFLVPKWCRELLVPLRGMHRSGDLRGHGAPVPSSAAARRDHAAKVTGRRPGWDYEALK